MVFFGVVDAEAVIEAGGDHIRRQFFQHGLLPGRGGRVEALVKTPEGGGLSPAERACGAEFTTDDTCFYICGFGGTIEGLASREDARAKVALAGEVDGATPLVGDRELHGPDLQLLLQLADETTESRVITPLQHGPGPRTMQQSDTRPRRKSMAVEVRGSRVGQDVLTVIE